MSDTTLLCNCDPPACPSLRRVGKYNENFGRLYYNCRKYGKGCGFFMWQEDAPRLRRETVTRPQPKHTKHDNNGFDSLNATIPLQKRASRNGSQKSQAASNSKQQSAAGPSLQPSDIKRTAQHEDEFVNSDNDTIAADSQSVSGFQAMLDEGSSSDDIDDDDDFRYCWEEASQVVKRAEAAQAATLAASKASHRPISAPVFLEPVAAGNHEQAEGSKTTYFGNKATTPTRHPLLLDRSSSPPRSPRHNSHDEAASTSWARMPQSDVNPPQQSTSRGYLENNHGAAALPHPSTPTRGGSAASTSLMTPQKTPIHPGAQSFQTATETAPPPFTLTARPLPDTPTSRLGAQSFQAATGEAPKPFFGSSIPGPSPFGTNKSLCHPALSEADEHLQRQDRKVLSLTKSKEALTRRNEELMTELGVLKAMLEEEKRDKEALKAELEGLKKDRKGQNLREGLRYDGDGEWGGSGFGALKRVRATSSRE